MCKHGDQSRFGRFVAAIFVTALFAGFMLPLDPARAANGDWTLSKTASPTTYSAAGQVISYTYVITNVRAQDGHITSLTDTKATITDCPANTAVPPAGLTCHGTYTITAADVVAGSVSNNATVTGDSCNDGCLVTANASATINLAANPSWTLAKTASPTTYTAGGQSITYSYLLTNTGNVTISSIAISDNKVVSVSCPATTLAAGANMTCTGSYSTTAADVSAGSVTNTATAAGTPASGTLTPVTASATIRSTAPPQGSITIIEVASGDPTFSFTSTIPGATSFSLTTVGGTASRSFTNLAPGTYTVTQVGLPLHWTLSNLTCTGDAGGTPTTVNPSASSATIGLDSGESITCTFTDSFQLQQHIQQTQAIIQSFLDRRIQLLADDGPDRNRFLRRIPGALWGAAGPTAGATVPAMPFTFMGNNADATSNMSFSTSVSQIMAYAKSNPDQAWPPIVGKARPKPATTDDVLPIDVWAEAHVNQFIGNSSALDDRGHFNIAYLGADYLFLRSVLVGFLVQYDWTGETSRQLNSSVDGHGWMAGPYVSARLSQNLFFDARAEWGTSSNSVNPFGLYTDKFATDRYLIQGNLTGNWWIGNFRVTPSAGITYVSEKQLSYTDSLGAIIPQQTVSLGTFAFGPEFAYRIAAANGITYEPQVAIKGIWNFIRPDSATIGGIAIDTDAVHAMAQAGMMAYAPTGYSVRIVGQYDGIGSTSFHSYGGQVWVNIPLH